MSNTATLVKRAPRAARISRKATLTAVDSVIDSKPKKIADLIGVNIKVKKGTKKPTELRWQLGSDPELGLYSHDEGRLVSAIPVLKRSKHDPIDLGDGIRFYFDNVQTELSFPPSDTKEEMIARLKTAFVRAHEHLGDRYSLIPKAAHWYEDKDMESSELGDPREIGCTPSFNFLDASVNQSAPFADNMRTGSFHIHLGNKDWQGDHDGRMLTFDSRHEMVRLFNLYVGLASVMFDQDEGSVKRRLIYGRAFEARPCAYGAEARTLSPYALRSPELVELVLDLVNHTMMHMANRTQNDILGAHDLHAVGAAINTCDKGAAWDILADLDLSTDMLKRIRKDYGMPDLKKSWGL